ncbi:MAG: hypothetical protein M3396_04430 [Actinomycetota bacterium]|nr:hypothetical protein [Actinomycetota bacterium]MDQ3573364.1 hypothetical protein [Actinomycetota bacterium]
MRAGRLAVVAALTLTACSDDKKTAPDCARLRSAVEQAKGTRLDTSLSGVDDSIARQAIEDAAAVAREAGCNVDDLVGPGVGSRSP